MIGAQRTHVAPSLAVLALAVLAAAGIFLYPIGVGASRVGASPNRVAKTTPRETSSPGTFTAIALPGALPHSARQLGTMAPATILHLAFALRPRDAMGLASIANAISSPNSPTYHHYLSPAEIAARFGPATSTIRAVERSMRALGLKVGGVSANHLMVDAVASVAAINRAFHTEMQKVALADGHIGWRVMSRAVLPAAIGHDISAVIGLNNLVVSHSGIVRANGRSSSRANPSTTGSKARHTPLACSGASLATRSGGGWTDSEIAAAYGLSHLYGAGDYGAGQTIAVVELEPFVMSDVSAFDRCYFGVSHANQVHRIRIAGFNELGSGSGESALDVESLSALAPGATIDVYEAPNTNIGTLDTYNQIVSSDSANLITTSWGECEQMLDASSPGARELENFIFEEAAAQGQTFIAATGDSGSDDCATTPFGSSNPVAPYLSVDDPASQPYVLGVGGTSLRSDVQPLVGSSEIAWNNGSEGGASGGGVSSNWASPSWQSGSGVPGVSTTLGRQVPDVSASADSLLGITVYSASFGQSGWTTIGGTSAAAPIWAAVLAEIAASGSTGTSCSSLPSAPGGQDLGFVPPLLYGAAASSYATTFHQISFGDNDAFHLGLGYMASAGYNMVGGLGSPTVTNPDGGPGLANVLCDEATQQPAVTINRPVITGLAPGYGSLAGGTSLAINLSDPLPAGAVVAVTVAGRAATVNTSSGSTVVVTVPQAQSTGSAVPAGGPALVSVTERVGALTATSAPSAASTYEYVDETTNSPSPSVTGVNPPAGNVTGGNTISIYGSGFTQGSTVLVGGRQATEVKVESTNLITAVAPARRTSTSCVTGSGFTPLSLCQTDVVVADAEGSSGTMPILPVLQGRVTYGQLGVVKRTATTEVAPAATEYDYARVPTIRAIRPDVASSKGRTVVRIVGTGFSLNTLDWVNFGPANRVGSEQLKVLSITPTTIDVRVPAAKHLSGRALPGGVSVQSSIGVSRPESFTYLEPRGSHR